LRSYRQEIVEGCFLLARPVYHHGQYNMSPKHPLFVFNNAVKKSTDFHNLWNILKKPKLINGRRTNFGNAKIDFSIIFNRNFY